jgi:hypothetical protein
MNDFSEMVLRTLAIGAGATVVMDAWAALLRRFGIPSLDFALLGRWIGHWRDGVWFHDRIASASPIEGERALGWLAHYAIGISFAALLVGVFGLRWARTPTLLPAILEGLVTVAAPLLVLQPALGLGIASSRTAAPLFNSLKSVVTHVVYGVGLYLAARATAELGAR